MNRDGQVWIDRNDHDTAYIVISGPHKNKNGWVHYTMFDTIKGMLCEWSEDPDWEEDDLLVRIT
jgi:hypothetical protein